MPEATIDRVWNVMLVGVGGQGVVLASDILAAAALEAGLDVKKSEIHGMSQRGGSVFSHVRFGPTVHSPTIPYGEVDVLYSLERIEALIEGLERRLWMTVYGVVAVILTQAVQSILEYAPKGG